MCARIAGIRGSYGGEEEEFDGGFGNDLDDDDDVALVFSLSANMTEWRVVSCVTDVARLLFCRQIQSRDAARATSDADGRGLAPLGRS